MTAYCSILTENVLTFPWKCDTALKQAEEGRRFSEVGTLAFSPLQYNFIEQEGRLYVS